MITLFRSDTVLKGEEIVSAVTKQLQLLPENIASIGEPKTIFRYEFKLSSIKVLSWLNNQQVKTKIYFSSREDDFEIGGIHIADEIKSSDSTVIDVFEYIENRVSDDNPFLRYYGGFAFDGQEELTGDWDGFKQAHFVVPRFEVLRTSEDVYFAVNICEQDISVERITGIIDQLKKIDFKSETSYRTAPIIESRVDSPEKDIWIKHLDSIMRTFNGDDFNKVVLARKSNFIFDKHIDPTALIKHLKDKTPECFHFCFQINPQCAFLGASPERLYYKNINMIKTEALAGTIPRGETHEEDTSNEAALAGSAKDGLEHKFVVDHLTNNLNEICLNFNNDSECKILKLKGSYHLLTTFEGTLKDRIENCTIMTALHPTPAVCGTPTLKALNVIVESEDFQRGWYAGPIGYVGAKESEFAVAIRSGLVNKNKLSLFAGAGIVAQSEPLSEWNEIENKISRFIKVFDVKVAI